MPPTRLILMRTSVTRGLILIFETTGMFILDYVIYRIITLLPFFIEMLQYDWL